MRINYKIVNQPLDLTEIINSPFIAQNNHLNNDHPNMWIISLNSKVKPTISIQDLSLFITTFIDKKREQLKQMNIKEPLMFYMWFDELASQLRFNIIPKNMSLPFECRIKIAPSTTTILQNFISTYSPIITWKELTIENNPYYEPNEDDHYILEVFTTSIN